MRIDSDGVFHFLDGPHGTAVPIHSEASWLILRLWRRGITVTADGDALVVRPKGALTDVERATLVRLKRHVLAALAYTPPGVH